MPGTVSAPDGDHRLRFCVDEVTVRPHCWHICHGRRQGKRCPVHGPHPPSCVAIVASTTVEHSAGGHTITDLLDEIHSVVGQPELLIRLDSVVQQTMRTEWRHANTMAFDRQLAGDSLRFFAARDIPSVQSNVPPEVSDVHFRTDLSGLQATHLHQLAVLEKLILATNPLDE